MQSKSKWPTILIVTLTLGLVFGPVFVPREISLWYLAAAHNAFRKKNSVLAEHYLSRAEARDPSVTKDGDYWVAQLPKFDLRNVDEQLDLLERAVMTDMRWQVEAREAAETLSEQLEFHHAVRALKIASLGQRPTNATISTNLLTCAPWLASNWKTLSKISIERLPKSAKIRVCSIPKLGSCTA